MTGLDSQLSYILVIVFELYLSYLFVYYASKFLPLPLPQLHLS